MFAFRDSTKAPTFVKVASTDEESPPSEAPRHKVSLRDKKPLVNTGTIPTNVTNWRDQTDALNLLMNQVTKKQRSAIDDLLLSLCNIFQMRSLKQPTGCLNSDLAGS